MSAPLIWILLPLVISALMLPFLRRHNLVFWVGLVVSVFLLLFAIFQPLGNILKAGPFSLEINTDLNLLGRRFSLTGIDQINLIIVYFCLTLFITGSKLAGLPAKFVPICLAFISLLTAAMAVDPFLYAAIFIELAVLLVLMLVVNKGEKVGRGILRFLIYQSISMPLMLFAGWILGGIQASPSDEVRTTLAAIFLTIGFAFWLAVFPLHTWIPQLSTESHPYYTGLILSVFPIVTLLIMVDYISGLVWLRSSPLLGPILRNVGVIMIVTAGLWSTFENDLRRIMAYSILFETGFGLLMISLQTDTGIRLLYLSFFPRVFSVALLALSLTVFLNHNKPFDLFSSRGIAYRYPFSSFAFLFSLLSIVGFPLFAEFPLKMETLKSLGAISYPVIIWSGIGITGLLFSTIRLFTLFTNPNGKQWQVGESKWEITLLVLGVMIILIWGIFPQTYRFFEPKLLIELPIIR